MKNLKETILEKLVITKDTREKRSGDGISFDNLINTFHRYLEKQYNKKHISSVLDVDRTKQIFLDRFDEHAEEYGYKLIDEKLRNHWKYEYSFNYCEKVLKTHDPISKSNTDIIATAIDVYFIKHINYMLDTHDRSKDDIYIYYINTLTNEYEIYEIIR